jgi:phage gp36-like protein
MADYLVQADLTTHIYAEKITDIIRNYLLTYANLAAFPVSGVKGRKYKATDTAKIYVWNGVAYEEIQDVDIVSKAINAAISETKSYLSRYDRTKLFDGTVTDENLKDKVKDIACWHLIKLANPNIDVAMFRTAYEDAIAWLKDIQRGVADPEGWLYPTDDSATDFDENTAVKLYSNTKRTNHY